MGSTEIQRILMEDSISIVDPFEANGIKFTSRIALAALTRCRCEKDDGCATDLHKQYYSDRAEGTGIVLSEAAAVSPSSHIFKGACCIFNEDQAKAWSSVVKAVQDKNAKFFIQLFHCGRVGPKEITGVEPVAPSSIKNREPLKSGGKTIEGDLPREASLADIENLKAEFIAAAKLSKQAGFDGIQFHCANGYLLDEFLRSATNKRTDKYGGSAENRCRFVLELIDDCSSIFDYKQMGVKISPVGCFNDINDENPEETFSYFLEELSKRGVLFVEIMESGRFKPCKGLYPKVEEEQIKEVLKTFKPYFKGIFMGNNAMTLEKANTLVKEGVCDMVSFGRLFIGNPDLPRRFKEGAELNESDRNSWRGGGNEGYNTYPKLNY